MGHSLSQGSAGIWARLLGGRCLLKEGSPAIGVTSESRSLHKGRGRSRIRRVSGKGWNGGIVGMAVLPTRHAAQNAHLRRIRAQDFVDTNTPENAHLLEGSTAAGAAHFVFTKHDERVRGRGFDSALAGAGGLDQRRLSWPVAENIYASPRLAAEICASCSRCGRAVRLIPENVAFFSGRGRIGKKEDRES